MLDRTILLLSPLLFAVFLSLSAVDLGGATATSRLPAAAATREAASTARGAGPILRAPSVVLPVTALPSCHATPVTFASAGVNSARA